jgi:hypothetical protein
MNRTPRRAAREQVAVAQIDSLVLHSEHVLLRQPLFIRPKWKSFASARQRYQPLAEAGLFHIG